MFSFAGIYFLFLWNLAEDCLIDPIINMGFVLRKIVGVVFELSERPCSQDMAHVNITSLTSLCGTYAILPAKFRLFFNSYVLFMCFGFEKGLLEQIIALYQTE